MQASSTPQTNTRWSWSAAALAASRSSSTFSHAPVQVTLIDLPELSPLPAAHVPGRDRRAVALRCHLPAAVAVRLRHERRVALAEVAGFDLEQRKVLIDDRPAPRGRRRRFEYDTLVVAAGSSYSYFGHDEWREVAGEVKSLESRSTSARTFSRRSSAPSSRPSARTGMPKLTFVIVGGGPTGVEIAGQIGELARDTLQRYYKHIDPGEARILLVEAADRILTSFPAVAVGEGLRGAPEARRHADRCSHTVVGIDSRRRHAPDSGRRHPADRGADRDLGGRRPRLAPGRAARRAGATRRSTRRDG